MKRRNLLLGLLAIPVVGGALRSLAGANSTSDINAMQTRWRDFLPKGYRPPPDGSLELSESQWRKKLTPQQFDVLRDDGTERAFSSPLNNEKQAGIFLCAGCDLPLFSSEMKYDSGTGWPSFFTVIPNAVKTKRDYRYGWTRVEYHCARCEGHQGHVFTDGPAPTRERWCNNGVALTFLAAS